MKAGCPSVTVRQGGKWEINTNLIELLQVQIGES